ncbi:SusC/RagA family TonB-linked outer membrane protein [Rapidithrix thailandica]|uniref:SusC/RagA family TonB-linked outer membrane protein n=1 Tax=Rapidithrix thailandica TaxID=413964 RepID=A0AAW9S1V4_9BACT
MNHGLRLYFLSILLLCFHLTQAQQTVVSGQVTSAEDGIPLPGVSVMLEGTSSGTISDPDGKYKITVPDDAQRLSFSFVGFITKTIEIKGQSVINVVLKSDTKQLKEVVITALGVSREKKSLGYAVKELDGEEVNTVKTTNVVSSLSGKVPGISVTSSSNLGGSSNIVIRGGSSITGNNQPLFVVDGVPISNSNINSNDQLRGGGGYDYGNFASDINPEDIESMSVLKGASATALYGSRGSNGVIIISTKKGSKRKGLGVSVSSSLTFSEINKATLPNYQNEYGGGDSPGFDEVEIDGKTYKVANYKEDVSWGPRFDGQEVLHWDAFDPTDKENYLKTRPWTATPNGIDAFFETGKLWVNNIALDGGNEHSSFRFSYTNTDEKGVLPNSSLKKNHFSFNGRLKLSPKLSTQVSVHYSNQEVMGRPGTGYDSGTALSLMASFGMWHHRQLDMGRLKNYQTSAGQQKPWNRKSYSDPTPNYWDNPYWTRYNNYPSDTREHLIGTWGLTYQLKDWLSLTGKASIDYNVMEVEQRLAKGSFSLSNYYRSFRMEKETNMDLMLNVEKDLGNQFSLSGLLAIGRRENHYDGIYESTVGGLELDNLYAISNSVSPNISKDEWDRGRRVNSVYGSISLGFRDMLFLDFTGRNDWSSTLPASKNHFFYPSISSSFVFSELPVFAGSSFLSFGKLRLNYAKVGNDAPISSILNTYYNTGNYGDKTRYTVNNTLNNAHLEPEETSSWEAGIEMSFWKDRLGVDISVYNKDSRKQILAASVSAASGYNYSYVNSGHLNNKGVEINLNAIPIRTKDFEWAITANWAKNESQVKKLAPGITAHVLNSNHVQVAAKEGLPYGALIGTNFVYKDGKPVVGSDGYYLQSEELEVLGNYNPDWRAGLYNKFSYKGLHLSALIDIRQGGEFFSLTHYWGMGTGVLEETAGLNDLGNPKRDPVTNDANSGGVIVPGVTENGDPNTKRVPVTAWDGATYYNNNPHANSVFDASYVKLREVSIGYTLPARLLEKLPFQNVTFAVTGRNLAILHRNFEHIDPEMTYGSGNVQGLDTGSLPTTRSYGFNLKFNF